MLKYPPSGGFRSRETLAPSVFRWLATVAFWGLSAPSNLSERRAPEWPVWRSMTGGPRAGGGPSSCGGFASRPHATSHLNPPVGVLAPRPIVQSQQAVYTTFAHAIAMWWFCVAPARRAIRTGLSASSLRIGLFSRDRRCMRRLRIVGTAGSACASFARCYLARHAFWLYVASLAASFTQAGSGRDRCLVKCSVCSSCTKNIHRALEKFHRKL